MNAHIEYIESQDNEVSIHIVWHRSKDNDVNAQVV